MMSERAKVFPYTKSSCLLSTQHAFCGKCCVCIASDPYNNLVCVWRSLLLSHFTDEGAKARVLHSLSHVFIKIFMVGPTVCWACVGKRGSQPETHPSWGYTRSFALLHAFPCLACSCSEVGTSPVLGKSQKMD